MNPEVVRRLSRSNMEALATALESGRAVPPYTRIELQPFVGASLAEPVAAEFSRLAAEGMQPAHAAYLLRLLATERGVAQDSRERVELVWTGDDLPGATGRDTALIVQELFASARKSVLIASYALDRGEKARTLFGALASRLDSEPGFSVRMCVNIQRSAPGAVSDKDLVAAYSRIFYRDWPGARKPQVFYDPRSLQIGGTERACQHAKCVVIDQEKLLVTSANFTEAAHRRNIEVGVLLDAPALALEAAQQFEALIRGRRLLPLPAG